MSDSVVESMQEIVSELKKEHRMFITMANVHITTGVLSATYRRQVAARCPELDFTSRPLEEP